MAKTVRAGSYDAIMRDIRQRKFAPVYILMGEESYFIDRICDAIATTALPEDEREFNQFVFFGAETKAGMIASTAREFPMMSEYKVVIVKEAQNIKNTDEIESYLDHPSPMTILVYCYKNGRIDSRKKLVTKAKSVGVVFDSKPVSDGQLLEFIDSFLAERKKTIDAEARGIIAESIGNNLCRLSTELDKLCLSMPADETRVTPDVVEQSISVSREYNPFKLREAVKDGDFVRANKILNYFINNPKSGGVYVLLPTLFSFFATLITAHFAVNKTRAGIAQYLELKWEGAAEEYITAMRHYDYVKTIAIISKIREFDEKTKGIRSTSATPDNDYAKELLYFIFH